MIPTTVFTPLEYGTIGLSEEAAYEKYGKDQIEVYHGHFQPLEWELPSRNKNKSFAKLVCLKPDVRPYICFISVIGYFSYNLNIVLEYIVIILKIYVQFY